MRKLFVFFAFSALLCVGFSKAGYEELRGLSVNFCSGSSDAMVVSPGEKKDLCLAITNFSTGDINIKLGFTEGTFTAEGYRACGPDSSDNNFAKLFALDTSDVYTIPASGSLVKIFPMTIPAWIKGQQYGCLIYQTVANESNAAGGLFNIQIRKAINLGFLVLDKQGDFKNDIERAFSMAINDAGEMIVTANFVSKSDFEQHIIFSGTVSNIGGFQKDFSNDFILKVAEGKKIDLNLGKVPTYKGLFTLTVDGMYQSDFGSMIVDIPVKYKEAISFSFSSTMYAFSWTQLVALIALLFLLFLIFRKRKVVYVQAPVPTSVPTPSA